MLYATFLRSQWQDLLDQWLGVGDRLRMNTAWIALPDLTWMTKLSEAGFPGGGGRWSPLPGVPPTEALMRRDAASRPQLWVRPEEKAEGAGRYADHWASFVAALGMGEAVAEVAGRKLAVDHLFPETAAARRGCVLVRVMPVDRRSYSQLGSTTQTGEAAAWRGHARPPR